MRHILAFFSDRRGATAIEYSFIAALIGIAIIAATQVLGAKVALVFTNVASYLRVS